MKKLITIILTCCALCGCFLKPYRPTIQQGNVIDPVKVSQLKLGMSKEQVKSIMGDSVLDDTFDQNYWSYNYTKQINGGKINIQELTLQFKNNKLVSINK